MDSAQTILTVALSIAGVLTPFVIAAGVRDRAFHDRIVSSEKAMNEKLDRAASEARDEFVRERDFTQAIERLEQSQQEMRNATATQINTIHLDIRNILIALGRIEALKV